MPRFYAAFEAASRGNLYLALWVRALGFRTQFTFKTCITQPGFGHP